MSHLGRKHPVHPAMFAEVREQNAALRARIAELEDENRKLSAIAEAASAYFSQPYENGQYEQALLREVNRWRSKV